MIEAREGNTEGSPKGLISFCSSLLPLLQLLYIPPRILYEGATSLLLPLFNMSYQPLDPTPSTSSKSSITSSQLRKWRPFVLLAAAALVLVAIIPTGSYTPLTTAAHDFIHSQSEGNPTIAVAEMQTLTNLMAKVSSLASILLFTTISAL